MLHHLAALPPTLQLEVLQTVSSRVLYAVPAPAPRLQAEPFGDAALTQVPFLRLAMMLTCMSPLGSAETLHVDCACRQLFTKVN